MFRSKVPGTQLVLNKCLVNKRAPTWSNLKLGDIHRIMDTVWADLILYGPVQKKTWGCSSRNY